MKTLYPKKILFAMRSAEYFHYYRTIIVALLHRGYHLRLICDRKWSNESSMAVFAEFQKEFPQFTYGLAVSRTDRWRDFLFHTRELLSYRRYLLVQKHRQSQYYEKRYFDYLGKKFKRVIGFSGVKYILKNKIFGNILRAIERVAPPFPAVIKDVQTYAPDAVIASPVNMRFSSAELEYLKASVAMGIPTVLPVISWDNLTTKGLIHIFPDRLLVWNDVQREEARDHQWFPEDRIRIIGAPVFDVWFSALKPLCTREQFCTEYGLRSADPMIVYLGSSSHMAQDETWLVEDLRKALDASNDVRLQRMQIIVRPHPSNDHIYERLKGLRDVAIIPEQGTLPDSDATLQLFYDALYHSIAAIDGANTSAIIDSIITGKPGIAILTDTYSKTQRETKHFNQLTGASALYLAQGVHEVPSLIKDLLDGKDQLKENRLAFIRRYVRPRGLDREAGEWAADEVEALIKIYDEKRSGKSSH